MNGRFQMQGGKNWFLPKEMNANRFFWDSTPNGGSMAMDSKGMHRPGGSSLRYCKRSTQREGMGMDLAEYQAMSSLHDVAHDGWLCTFT
jgi:hypothetical protein